MSFTKVLYHQKPFQIKKKLYFLLGKVAVYINSQNSPLKCLKKYFSWKPRSHIFWNVFRS